MRWHKLPPLTKNHRVDLLNVWQVKEDGLPDKQEFHRIAKLVCRQIAKDLELEKGTFDIRTNMGGDAVGGETILHSDHFYLQFCAEGYLEILYRACHGRRNFVGGTNQWTTYQRLVDDYPGFLSCLPKPVTLG